MTWDDALKVYDDITEACNGFERKGKNMIFTSSNGYMFTLLNKDAEIGIRLPKEEAAKFMEMHNTGHYYSYGAKMKDYVLVPESLWNNKKLLVNYFEQSFAYVNSLPSK
jgi:TfoX/Sxy family transcriptional regulator of competence genes